MLLCVQNLLHLTHQETDRADVYTNFSRCLGVQTALKVDRTCSVTLCMLYYKVR